MPKSKILNAPFLLNNFNILVSVGVSLHFFLVIVIYSGFFLCLLICGCALNSLNDAETLNSVIFSGKFAGFCLVTSRSP